MLKEDLPSLGVEISPDSFTIFIDENDAAIEKEIQDLVVSIIYISLL